MVAFELCNIIIFNGQQTDIEIDDMEINDLDKVVVAHK